MVIIVGIESISDAPDHIKLWQLVQIRRYTAEVVYIGCIIVYLYW